MKKWKIGLFWNSIGREEIRAVTKVLRSGRLTMGEQVERFEAAWSKRLKRFCVMVSSGSSANLLMIAVAMQRGWISAGDRVAIPGLCWPTTVWAMVRYGLRPHFDDHLFADRSAGVAMAAHIHVPLYGAYAQACPDGSVCLEDACETTVAKESARMSTLSFYFSHHMTTGEGGMVCCRDADTAELVRSFRAHGWVRETPSWKGKTHSWMDRRFTFPYQGYNVRPTEIAAAIGLVQLKKLDGWNARRRELAHRVTGRGVDYPPFGLIFMSRRRAWVRRQLEAHGIETRPVLAGMMWQQPGMDGVEHTVGATHYAESMACHGFSVGCHPGMSDADAAYLRRHLLKVGVI